MSGFRPTRSDRHEMQDSKGRAYLSAVPNVAIVLRRAAVVGLLRQGERITFTSCWVAV